MALTLIGKIDREDRSSARDGGIAGDTAADKPGEGLMTSDETNPRSNKPKQRCEICNGSFGLIRHRFAHKQFCSNRCLEQYLVKRKQQPSSVTQWIDFSRN